MEVISVLKANRKLVVTEKGVTYCEKINDQKARVNQNGGRPAGTECGNSCSCS